MFITDFIVLKKKKVLKHTDIKFKNKYNTLHYTFNV